MKNLLNQLKRSLGFETPAAIPPETVSPSVPASVPVSVSPPVASINSIPLSRSHSDSIPVEHLAFVPFSPSLSDSVPVSDSVSVPDSVSPAVASTNSVPRPLSSSNADPYSRPAAHMKREELIKFILKGMLPYVDETTRPIAGIRVYYKSSDALEDQINRVALHMDEPVIFQQEYLERKLLNHFIPLDHYWFYEYVIVKKDFPENIFIEKDFGLEILHRGQAGNGPYQLAKLTIMRGYAEKKVYSLNPSDQLKFQIGRSKNPQLPSGRIQHNDIAFMEKTETTQDNEQVKYNQHISRNHAYIRFNPQSNKYLLYPDYGGLPENGNKLKIHSGDLIKWLSIPNVGHELQDGDQIELGGEALIQFNLQAVGNGQ